MSPFQKLFACAVSKKLDTFLSPGLEVTKCLSPLDSMLIYVSTPGLGPAEVNWSFIFDDNAGHSVEWLLGHKSGPTKIKYDLILSKINRVFLVNKLNIWNK